jgi:hypothetical protein
MSHQYSTISSLRRTGRGDKLRVRLPFAGDNRRWLQNSRRRAPDNLIDEHTNPSNFLPCGEAVVRRFPQAGVLARHRHIDPVADHNRIFPWASWRPMCLILLVALARKKQVDKQKQVPVTMPWWAARLSVSVSLSGISCHLRRNALLRQRRIGVSAA